MEPMSMMKEPEIKRWTAKRKVELIKQIYRGQTTIAEAARTNDITQQEIERWMDEAEMGMENALKANPKDVEQLYQKKIDDLHAAYGEAMLENKFLKKLRSHLESTEE
jgi:transposase-like protein